MRATKGEILNLFDEAIKTRLNNIISGKPNGEDRANDIRLLVEAMEGYASIN